MKLASLAFVLLAACSSHGPRVYQGLPTMHFGETVDPAKIVATTSTELELDVNGRKVGATIVAPTGVGPWPALVLLAGSGPTDRNWNNPLIATTNGSGKLVAEEIAKHGAVVIRFDKAGTGTNKGPADLPSWTLDTYREEALAAIDALIARKDVRADAVFIAGHSEGGLHATRAALAAGSKLRGIIYLSSASRSMWNTMMTQIENQMRGSGMSAQMVDAELASMRAAGADYMAGKPMDPKKASTLPPLQAMFTGFSLQPAQQMLRALMAFDNASEAPKLTIASLVINGAKDVQVDPELDAKHLADAIKAAGRDVTLHIAPNADHVLKTEPRTLAEIRANLQQTQDAYNADGRVLDPDVATTIETWIGTYSPR